jgi:hypothetical protein
VSELVLRSRRYVDDVLVDETLMPAMALDAEATPEMFAPLMALADKHGEWSALCSAEGLAWREVIDDATSGIVLVAFDDALMRAGYAAFLLRAMEGLLAIAAHYEGNPS